MQFHPILMSFKSEKRKCGRKSFVCNAPTKQAFLERGLARYRSALKDQNPNFAVRRFYTNFTTHWIVKYGYDLPLEEDVPEDLGDPTDAMVEEFSKDDGSLPKEEIESRREYHKMLREVR